MDPVDPIHAVIKSEGAMLGTHEQALQYLDKQRQAISGTQANMLSFFCDIHAAFFSCDVPCPSTCSCFSGEAATAFLSLSKGFFMFWPIEVCPYDVFLAELKKAFAHPISEFSIRATVVLPNLYFCKQKMTWWRTTSLKYLSSKKI